MTRKKSAGGPTWSYDDAVEEALAYGWVDSLPRALDAERTMLYFSPRKRGSGWSAPNKARVARLETADLMTPAGRRIIDAAKADGSWTMLDDVEAGVVPDDLSAALGDARTTWDAYPRSVRRGLLETLVQAKRPETRAERIVAIAEAAARGERPGVFGRRR